jgi:uncharacterized iron-regulated protein
MSRRLPAVLLALVLSGALGCGGPQRPDSPAPAPPDPPAAEARLFEPTGIEAGISEVVEASHDVDVLFVGERHGDPAVHRFQYLLLHALLQEGAEEGRGLILSLEMFERDVQGVLDEYLDGLITEEQFLAAARPWTNYQRDYRPLVERARAEGIPVVAANAPRRYVNRVSRLGADSLDGLPEGALGHLPPLPFPGPSDAYRTEWEERMAALAHGDHGGHGAHVSDAALEAQALWDAAMAHSIHQALSDAPRDRDPDARGPLVLHLTGSFHVENRTGTPEALRHYRPDVRDLVITSRAAEDPEDFAAAVALERAVGLADFILLTPAAGR